MKIEEWLALKGLKQRELAEMIGAHPSMVTRWISGESRPTAFYIDRLERATKKKVKFADFNWTPGGTNG